MHLRVSTLLPIVIAGLLVGCGPRTVYVPTPTKTPDPAYALALAEPTATPPATLPPTTVPSTPAPTPTVPTATPEGATPTLSLTVTGTQTEPPPTLDASLPSEHYWLERPIPNGWRDFLDRNYAYGATAGGQYRPHTGVEFPNPIGTPVVAVGNGVIYYSGTDAETIFGPQPNFYGNLIILQLGDYTYNGQPIYVLYGHLSEIYAQTGQAVAVREIIGAVGGTGVANGGPHLHFEVRIGDPTSYTTSTRNPDLWLKPYYGYGTLAGRIVDANGAMLPEVAITLRGPDTTRYTWTYAGAENIPDEQWQENFTLGDLPEGWYTLTTRSARRTYSEQVYIRNGHTTWIELVFD